MFFSRFRFSRLLRSACVLLVSFSFSDSFAIDASSPTGEASAEEIAMPQKNRDESWYWGFSIGGGSVRYKNARFQTALDALKVDPAINHLTAGYDFYFLWPLANRKTAVGVALGGTVDSYTAEAANEQFSATSVVTGFSIHHYLTSNIGDGFFVRGDFGLATTQLQIRQVGITANSDTYRGLGLRLAAGYSIVLSNETRLPITLHWLHVNSSEGDTTNSSALLTVGALF